jgi:hypothetical protein
MGGRVEAIMLKGEIHNIIGVGDLIEWTGRSMVT